ncbi:MAG TPA: phosphatase PAP2 family protein [Opitutaceae bacterium]|nr:phosphatase PAP2 family protein [Opitutaceae bacterium]
MSERLRAEARLKAAGVTIFGAAFFAAYFLTLKYPLFLVTQMPYTALDRAIPFQPHSFWLYASLWVYVVVPPALLKDRSQLVFYGAAASAVAFAGLLIFFFWPTAVPNPDIDWNRFPSLLWLKSVDASGNACPSLHAAFAVFSGLWLHRILRQMGAPEPLKLLNGAWCVAILWSALALKQHVAVDILAGSALGAFMALPRGRRFRARGTGRPAAAG